MPSILAEIAVALLILCSGACNSIVSKLLYQTDGKTFDGTIKYFEKPWLLTAIMFLGEFFCLFIYGISWVVFRCVKKDEEDENSLDSMSQDEQKKNDKIIFIAREDCEGDPTSGLTWKYPFYVLLFAACDLISTTMMSIGLVYCNASVIQIIRGMVIVFTLLFSWAFLGRKPNLFQVTGVLFALVGLVLVGVSAVMSDDSGTTKFQGKSLLGIGLTLISQIFSAIQFTFEEKLLKGINIPPLFLVGSEGMAGFILCCAIALPAANAIHGSDYGVQEYFKSTIYMTFHIPQVTALVFTSAIAVCILNWTSFVYVKYLSAVARTLVNACRTILVWIIMVILYYASKHVYGEGVNYWSILQAAGFILMMIGTTAHNNIAGFGEKVIRITCCCFLDENQAEQKIDDDEKKLDSSISSEKESDEKKNSTVLNEKEDNPEV